MNKTTEIIGGKVIQILLGIQDEAKRADAVYKKYHLKKHKAELDAMMQWRMALMEVLKHIQAAEADEEELIKAVFDAGFNYKCDSHGDGFKEFYEKEFARYTEIKEPEPLFDEQEVKEESND